MNLPFLIAAQQHSGGLLAAQQQSGGLLSLLILVLPIGAIVLLMIVPQRRQRQKQAELLNKLSVGDEVVTIGGLYGVINHLEDDSVHLEVDNDVVIRVSRGAISRTTAEPDPAAAERTRGAGGLLGGLLGSPKPASNGAADGPGSDSGDSGDADAASSKD